MCIRTPVGAFATFRRDPTSGTEVLEKINIFKGFFILT
jgi:hypothetical protein